MASWWVYSKRCIFGARRCLFAGNETVCNNYQEYACIYIYMYVQIYALLKQILYTTIKTESVTILQDNACRSLMDEHGGSGLGLSSIAAEVGANLLQLP